MRRTSWAVVSLGSLIFFGCRLPMDVTTDRVPGYGEGSLRITEIEPTSNGSWIDENGEATDWFELWNSGSETLSLNGYAVSRTNQRDQVWTFPGRVLGPDQRIVLAASGQNRKPKIGVLHTDFTLPAEGGVLYLWKDADLIDRVTYPALFEDQSFVRSDQGWSATNAPTPAQANLVVGAEVLGLYPLRFEEVQTSNPGTWLDDTGSSPDWIEVRNTGASPLDLSGWWVGASKRRAEASPLPAMTLQAGERLVLAASGSTPGTGSTVRVPFTLDPDGDRLYLWRETVLIDRVLVPALFDDQTYARFEGGWTATNVPTPGGENAAAVAEPGAVYPLRISEVQTSNKGVWIDDGGKTSDWLEISNESDQAVDLEGYSLGKDRKVPEAWTFPKRTLEPGGRLVIAASGENRKPVVGDLHTDFALGATGETLYLWYGSLLVDRVIIPPLPEGQSYTRVEGVWESSSFPSPGAPNVAGIAAPGFSHPGGLVTDASISLRLSGTGNLRYTLDGSTPDLLSAVLGTNPLDLADPDLSDGLPGGVVVSARLERDGRLGPVVTHTYLFYPPGSPGAPGAGPTEVAVVSLAGSPAGLVDAPDGLLNRDHDLYDGTEVGLNLEFFEPGSGTPAYSSRAGAQLFGAASRSFNAQKALGLFARSVYQDGKFRYPFFPGLKNTRGREIVEFDSLVLRAAGNDSGGSLLRDVIMTGLMDGSTVDHQAYRPVSVFVNGRYWGFYQLREKVNEAFLASHHPEITGLPLDLLSNYSEVNAGSNLNFTELQAYLDNHSPSDPAVWDQVSRWIDIDQFTDYQIAQIYFGNTDWPGNNIKYWRPTQAGAPWRWILFDTDFGFGAATNWDHDTLGFALEAAGGGWPNPPHSTLIFRKLIENSDYQARFLARFDELLTSRFSPSVVAQEIDSLAGAARDEILSRHWKRWNAPWMSNGYPGTTTAWDNQIQGMKDWSSQRVGFLRPLLVGYFQEIPVVRHNGTGLRAEYFKNADYRTTDGTPVVVRVDPVIDYVRVGDSEPAPGIGPENYSVRWTGTLRSSLTGPVRLTLSGDDGVRLWWNGGTDPLINGWFDQGTTAYSAVVDLVAGQDYPVRIEHYQGMGGAEVHLRWSVGRFSELIPSTQFYPAP